MDGGELFLLDSDALSSAFSETDDVSGQTLSPFSCPDPALWVEFFRIGKDVWVHMDKVTCCYHRSLEVEYQLRACLLK